SSRCLCSVGALSISCCVVRASRSRTGSSRILSGSLCWGISHLRVVHPYGVAAAARYGSARSVISLAAAISNLSSPLHRHDFAVRSRLGGERRPLLHQPAPLLEHVAAPVCGLDLAADDVCQRHLGNLARKVRSLGCPIAEARSEAVNGDAVAHANQ